MSSAKYPDLSRQELLEKAARLGSDFEKFSGSCSQCTVVALREILGFEDIIVKVATSSCGGQAGLSNGVCGAVIGGTIVLDYYLGRPMELVSCTEEIPEGLEVLSSAMETARSFCKKFTDQYGSILCPGIQTTIYGRSFDLQNPDDWEAFMDAGAHSDPTKCMSVVGNAAKWALETLMETGKIRTLLNV
ncbi:MAG: C_GCAxxG_C_C family protein [Acidobacteria bacterium]|nr:C_GCAxxG_C_C family protein [Acidobacteriota bacterium]